ncbi:hypothetical protein K493DRAFT_63822 [Basidiobolus meristosporus CBS 931.73]|uniref:Uncharacterized protein n=1 Tax=Basidiobolus meristosporus CBS 931.73 TaxID=1314790 RepID=A0A1Y1XW08_9FUNG|nr:hypothetical protein K493DRAFT_63822 [Basidiobolus meristosporus CBS 931.73]|eukprot:ORX89941.1 hypothetical protein K493DRAFT_63822 [Basidiobolus meristosporus CBS 931.73]
MVLLSIGLCIALVSFCRTVESAPTPNKYQMEKSWIMNPNTGNLALAKDANLARLKVVADPFENSGDKGVQCVLSERKLLAIRLQQGRGCELLFAALRRCGISTSDPNLRSWYHRRIQLC